MVRAFFSAIGYVRAAMSGISLKKAATCAFNIDFDDVDGDAVVGWENKPMSNSSSGECNGDGVGENESVFWKKNSQNNTESLLTDIWIMSKTSTDSSGDTLKPM
jgi:hypothetical protein